MPAAVLEQEPLFAAVGAHMITVEALSDRYAVEGNRAVTWRTADWFAWSCSCGDRAREGSRWSHPDLAERMGVVHAERVTR